MNIRTEKIESGEEEIIIRYREMTDEISNVIDYLNRADKSIAGHKVKELFLLKYGDILYFECVDNVVFAYTDSEAYQIYFSLTELEDKIHVLFPMQQIFYCKYQKNYSPAEQSWESY